MEKSDTHVSKNWAQESLALFLDTGDVDFFKLPAYTFKQQVTFSTASENMKK